MAVRAGRELLAIPGPTNIPDEVLQAMHRPAVDMYSAELIGLTDSLLNDLGRLFGTLETSLRLHRQVREPRRVRR